MSITLSRVRMLMIKGSRLWFLMLLIMRGIMINNSWSFSNRLWLWVATL